MLHGAKIVTLLLILCAFVGGCDVSADVIAARLIEDAPCFAKAGEIATSIESKQLQAEFGFLPGQRVKASTLLANLANGKATQVPIEVLAVCGPLLANL